MMNSDAPQKSSSAYADMLRVADADYVRVVKQMLEEGPPAAWVMCVVAYQNLQPMLAASFRLAKENPTNGAPSDIDSFIQLLGARLEQTSEEISQRRLGWFFQAALIYRATELAAQNCSLQKEVAAIWIMLARGSAYLCNVLPKNILWSEDEKAYFDMVKTEKEGIHYCLRILAPAYLRKSNYLTSFAESKDILLVPW